MNSIVAAVVDVAVTVTMTDAMRVEAPRHHRRATHFYFEDGVSGSEEVRVFWRCALHLPSVRARLRWGDGGRRDWR